MERTNDETVAHDVPLANEVDLPGGNSNQRSVVALAIILATASFVMRYSLSHASYGPHIDEPIVANLTHRAINDGILSANWDHFSINWWTKPTYQFSPYSLVLEGTAIVTHKLLGWPGTIQDHIRFARTMSCIFGALTVLLAFFTARALFGQPWTALLCELILAVAFLHVRDSTYARVETFLVLTISGCIYLAAKSLQPGAAKGWSYATAIAGGIVVAAKYNAVPILIPVAFAAFATINAARRTLGTLLTPTLKYGALMAVGFLIATPEAIFAPGLLVHGIMWESNHYSEAPIPYCKYDFWDNNLFYLSRYLFHLGLGPVASLLGLGFIYLAWQKKSAPYFLLVFYVYVSIVLTILPPARFERNYEVFLAPLAIAAGATGGALLQYLRMQYSPRIAQLATVALVLGLVVPPTMAAHRFRIAIRPDSSPMTSLRTELPPRDESTLTFQMFDAPPNDLPDAERIVVVDYRDNFSAAQSDNWDRMFSDYDRTELRSTWSAHGYPFSIIDAVHGPARLIVYDRRDSSDRD